MQFPDLSVTLTGLPWAVVGAAATRMYMPERVTDDLDILIESNGMKEASKLLIASGARKSGDLVIGSESWTLSNGFPLDVLACHEPWCKAAIAEAQHNLDPQGMPVLPLAWLSLMKYRVSRVQDLADLTRMLGQAEAESLEQVRAAFTEWEPSAIDDLESLIHLGRLELEQGGGGL